MNIISISLAPAGAAGLAAHLGRMWGQAATQGRATFALSGDHNRRAVVLADYKSSAQEPIFCDLEKMEDGAAEAGAALRLNCAQVAQLIAGVGAWLAHEPTHRLNIRVIERFEGEFEIALGGFDQVLAVVDGVPGRYAATPEPTYGFFRELAGR